MRLAGPVYESLPYGYVALGALAMLVSYVDTNDARSMAQLVIGLLAQVAGVTLFLHRRDCRLRRDQYPCESIDKTVHLP